VVVIRGAITRTTTGEIIDEAGRGDTSSRRIDRNYLHWIDGENSLIGSANTTTVIVIQQVRGGQIICCGD
jgi:hypothetical protein